jgi:ADP-ribose pyrophosphatase
VDLTERCVAHVELFKGRLLHAFRDDVELPDGTVGHREYIMHPGAVMIIPLVDRADGTQAVILERQFRYPVGETLIELPAGKRDPGEDSLATAQRELREETGFCATEWAFAGKLQPAVGYSNETIDVWFARMLRAGKRKLDAGEFLEIFEASPDELLTWCQSGRVIDSKTLVGALWLQNVLSGAWKVTWNRVPAGPHGWVTA